MSKREEMADAYQNRLESLYIGQDYSWEDINRAYLAGFEARGTLDHEIIFQQYMADENPSRISIQSAEEMVAALKALDEDTPSSSAS